MTDADVIRLSANSRDPIVRETTKEALSSMNTTSAKTLKEVISWQSRNNAKTVLSQHVVAGVPWTGACYLIWSFPGKRNIVLRQVNGVFTTWFEKNGPVDQVAREIVKADAKAA